MTELRYPFDSHPPPGTTVEVAPGVLWLTMPMGGGSLNHINLYLLADDDGWWVFDTGLPLQETAEYWQQIFSSALGGRPVVGVICSHMHPDHIGQSGMITEQFHCPLYMTRTEYYQARTFSVGGPSHYGTWQSEEYFRRAGMPADYLEALRTAWMDRGASNPAMSMAQTGVPGSYIRLQDGEILTIGGREWRVVVGQGHSPEHACLYSSSLKLLLSGDQILPVITSNVSVHANEPLANPLMVWMESLDRLLAIPADTFVLPAHNLPFYGVRDRLRGLMSHHEDRMLAIEEHCAVEPATAKELLPVLFARELDARQMTMALGEAIAHLHLLMHRNRIERELCEDGCYRYRSIDPDLGRRSHPDRHDAPSDQPVMV